jgi:hypothetical protein
MAQLGDVHVTTTFHSTTAGDARVELAVTLIAGANINLAPDGTQLLLTPNKDDANTKFAVELIAVQQGKQEAGDEIEADLQMLAPAIVTFLAEYLELPPIAIPALDLGTVTPGFAGRTGRFQGALRFDADASRIGLDGEIIAR